MFTANRVYRTTLVTLSVLCFLVGIVSLFFAITLTSKTAALKIALFFSEDVSITESGLQRLSVAIPRLRILGVVSITLSIFTAVLIFILPRAVRGYGVVSCLKKFLVHVLQIRWGEVLGVVGLAYLCFMLIVANTQSPLSIDAAVRYDGARQYIKTGKTMPSDAGGRLIRDREDEPLVRYVPAIWCIALGGNVTCITILYSALCMLCVLTLGYIAGKVFGKRAIGYTVFLASMPFFVHQVAADSARTEFAAMLLLLVGTTMLFTRKNGTRWSPFLACAAIGLATWMKYTLLVIVPAFVLTGLITGLNKELRSRSFITSVGPLIGVCVIWLIDTVIKLWVLEGGKAAFARIFSYWFTSSVHGTLGTVDHVSIFNKLALLDSVFAVPLMLGIGAITVIILITERFSNPFRLFIFLTTFGWASWWFIFDSSGLLRHFLIGFLFLSILVGGFIADTFEAIQEERGSSSYSNAKLAGLGPSGILGIVILAVLFVFTAKSVNRDFEWIEWAMNMHVDQEKLVEYVTENKGRVLFSAYGPINAHNVVVLADEPFWDINKGIPPESIRLNRKMQIVIAAWQMQEADTDVFTTFADKPYVGIREIVDIERRLVTRIGNSYVYEAVTDED